MNKTILFSPIGGTDPISEDNFYDGSMLHICRHFKPDIVYLYLSAAMVKKEELDHRYTKCIELLSKHLNHIFEVKLIKTEITEVHNFDYFYDEFESLLRDIFEKKDNSDQVLLNISSGTPGMKGALNVIRCLGEFDCKCIMVEDPLRSLSNRSHSNEKIDVEQLFEFNLELEKNGTNRCKENPGRNLLYIRDKRNIVEFIKKYDYEAAYQLIKQLPSDRFEKYMPLISFAKARYSLNLIEANKLKKEFSEDCMLVNGDNQKIFEYALACDIKKRKGELADFIRSLTPLILELFIKIAEKQVCRLSSLWRSVKSCKGNGETVIVWDKNEIIELAKYDDTVATIKDALESEYEGFFNCLDLSTKDYIRSDHICTILKQMCSGEIADDVAKLRENVEQTIRNKTAHQMVQVDETSIKKLTGMNSDEIIDLIKKLFSYTDLKISKKSPYWDSYDRMNEILIDEINK